LTSSGVHVGCESVSTDITKPYSGAFVGRIHHFAARVYIEDTDLGGVVYHANYLRFLERARSDLLRCLGIHQLQALESGQGVYAVVALEIQYRRPARLDDDLVITSSVEQIGGASAVLHQEVLRAGEKLAQARVTLGFLSPNGRPRRHPAEWMRKLNDLESKTGDKLSQT
jgi:acyl-CoA thioester hydrolase